ncbi:pseudaminic acid cytidylyltransferase [Aquimarina sp. MMG016]|uniref:pseudaminic acid cytidylyltransferase n=1 Tax=Aquimarina sp. MMG016 TaxID=2822690 RepID=UPI001B3A0BA9|nr:pseudaminic acid cytidylyltransferase [Aquimarina sp. MMG016]MBQ4820076.1 pseudaminic acid cytidylyltransferase [Aquimarina sp. MMG016]
MSNVVIIPARGGSKRIPRKNLKFFLGKPIIAYSIKAALEANIFDEVMVSTDDVEIAEIAKKYGASVPFLRSTKNSDDYATTYDVINEVINCYKERQREFDYTCCLYPTAPFVSPEQLIKAFNLLKKDNTDGVLTVTPYSYPIQRSLSLDETNFIKMNSQEHLKTRSQDLKESYHDVGQFYFYKTKRYLEKKSIFNMRCKPIILSEMEAQDIDNEVDWQLAELKYKLIKSN